MIALSSRIHIYVYHNRRTRRREVNLSNDSNVMCMWSWSWADQQQSSQRQSCCLLLLHTNVWEPNNYSCLHVFSLLQVLASWNHLPHNTTHTNNILVGTPETNWILPQNATFINWPQYSYISTLHKNIICKAIVVIHDMKKKGDRWQRRIIPNSQA